MDLNIEHLIYLATAISIKANPRQAALQVEVFAIPVTETRYACWILVYRKPVALEIVTKMFRKLVGSEFCKGKPGVRCDSVLKFRLEINISGDEDGGRNEGRGVASGHG